MKILFTAAAGGCTSRGLLAHVVTRRSGDTPALVACAEMARRELVWHPRHPELKTILSHTWRWHQTLHSN